ncbi:GLPGLI family protein [Jiulongibacter sediminis]|uniref:GLPGLI family protein n=1 Tax=Jiulongibacter sediminis TaxID=1605367 RepID=UPI0009EB9206|nr:GLPGLI family protein [Jiulongibacter sediminis]
MKSRILRAFIIFLLSFLSLVTKGQNLTGEIEFRYRINYAEIYASAEYITEQERDRIMLSWGNEEGYSTRMKLQFSPEKTVYTYGEPYELNAWSSFKDNYFIIKNFAESTSMLYLESLGKTYLIEDELKVPKWRIMNELREIVGHMCMKAVTQDTLKGQEIVAWFAADIPVPGGPENLNGLPGMILGYEVNGTQLLVEAERIVLGEPEDPIKLPKKMKGKKVNWQEYNESVAEFIDLSVKAKRPWYWSLRF